VKIRLAGSMLLLGALASACGGSAAAPSARSSSPSGPQNANRQAYRQCLKEHGVNLPPGSGRQQTASPGIPGQDGGFPGGPAQAPPGVDQQEFQDAQQACQDKLPAGNGRNGFGAAATAYRSCLADHGVKSPSPTPSGPPPRIDVSDPAFQAASAACSALLPGPPQNGQNGPGPDGGGQVTTGPTA